MQVGSKVKFDFSLDNTAITNTLRKIAEDIEQGKVIPQKFVTYNVAQADDYAMESLVLKFAQGK